MHWHRLGAVLVALLLLGSFGLSYATVGATMGDRKYEMRAVWITTNYGLDWPSRPATSMTDEERQQAELVRLLDQLQELGINTVFLQVRSRGRVIYPSEIEPMSGDFVPVGSGYKLSYDPLDFAIKECHKRGMVVHAWVAVTPMGNDKQVNNMPAWSYPQKHRSELARYRRSWYLDPAKPSSTELVCSVVRELLDRYALAGIHLDYIRYPDRAKQFPDADEYRQQGGGKSLDEWRRENINRMVRGIYKATKEEHPEVLLSASVIGTYDNVPGLRHSGWTALNEAWQDPVAWCRDSVIDFVVPMMYARGDRFYPFVKEWQKILNVPLVVGLAPYMVLEREGNWPKTEVMEQIHYLDSLPNIAGMALFRAEHAVSNGIGLVAPLKEHWAKEASLPLDRGVWMDWLDGQDLTIEGHHDGLHVTWHGSSRGQLFALYLSSDGTIPNGVGAPYLVTTKEEATIPWRALQPGQLIGIKVSEYNLSTHLEVLPFSGGVFYYREEAPLGTREGAEKEVSL